MSDHDGDDADHGFHLAEFNVATLKAPLDHPATAEFVGLLDPLNALADGAPGFVWRLVEDGAPDATALRPIGADVIVNFSVWESRKALRDYAYRSGHLEALRRRREWFERHIEAHLVMWWIPAGHIPSIDEGIDHLRLLRANGPSPRAFTFGETYSPHDAGQVRGLASVDGSPGESQQAVMRCESGM